MQHRLVWCGGYEWWSQRVGDWIIFVVLVSQQEGPAYHAFYLAFKTDHWSQLEIIFEVVVSKQEGPACRAFYLAFKTYHWPQLEIYWYLRP